MTERRFNINNWEVTFLVYVINYDINRILALLRQLNAPANILIRITENCRRNEKNVGFTYSNKTERKSIVVIGRTSNGAQFLNTYSHELRHLVDDIADVDDMDIAGEPVAYLTGDICNFMSDIICRMSCECCRNKNIPR